MNLIVVPEFCIAAKCRIGKVRAQTQKRKKRVEPTGQARRRTGKSMPKIPRTPLAAGNGPPAGQTPSRAEATPNNEGGSTTALETLLLAMEGRLGTKIDSTNKKVDRALSLAADTNAALEDLESRLTTTDKKIEKRFEEAEERIQSSMAGQVKSMVLDQLREAGFDPDLTAGALSTIQASSIQTSRLTQQGPDTSYAAAAAKQPRLTDEKPRSRQ